LISILGYLKATEHAYYVIVMLALPLESDVD